MRPELHPVDPAVLDEPSSEGDDGWLITHHCGGIERALTVAGHHIACLACGDVIAAYPMGDLSTGEAVVIGPDGEPRATSDHIRDDATGRPPPFGPSSQPFDEFEDGS